MNNTMDIQEARTQLVSQKTYYQNMADALGVAIANLDSTFAPSFKELEDTKTALVALTADKEQLEIDLSAAKLVSAEPVLTPPLTEPVTLQ